MTIGDWIVTFIILSIPLVGIVMQFVWALSSDTQPSKKSFCQASLIMFAAIFVLAIIAVVAFGGLAAIMGGMQQQQLQQGGN